MLIIYATVFLSTAWQPLLVDKGLLIVEDSKSPSDKTYSFGLLWSSDKPDAETSFREHNTHKT